MCRQTVPCCCPCSNKIQQCYRVSLQIQQPYECICQPCSKSTQIETNDVVSGLLKYNSNLTKYLAKYQSSGLPQAQKQDKQINADQYRGTVHHPEKSIVQLYNLKILSSQQYPAPVPSKPENPQKPTQTDFPQIPAQPPNPNIPNGPNPGPKPNPNRKPKPEPGSNEEKIQKHLDELAKGSRYLPNSGFKKYFGRECFENYGRENTNGVADGIVYNNYLKTFNIAPHSGGNAPVTQETFKRTLIAGDRKGYDNRNIPDTHYGGKQDREDAEGYHKKTVINMPQIVEESQKYEQQQIKYSRAKYQPKLNIISHCPDIIPTTKHQTQTLPRNQNLQRTQRSAQKQTAEIEITRTKGRGEQAIRIQQGNTRGVLNDVAEMSQITYQPQRRVEAQRKNQSVDREGYGKGNSYAQVNRQDDGWDQNQLSDCDRLRKKQIMEACYKSNNVAHEVQLINKPKCSVCSQFRFTKCCCH